MILSATAGRVVDWRLHSSKGYAISDRDVEVSVDVAGPSGRRWKVPAFWAGEREWGVRFSAAEPGSYRFESRCSDASNEGLHGCTGVIEIEPFEETNPLYSRGPLEVDQNGHSFRHGDGTPFLWLADTWWMGTARRLRWPEDFEALAYDRRRKGFTVVMLVVGYFPDMDTDDPRNANEAGQPWSRRPRAPRPAFFDLVDLRIQRLVERGIVPCVVGSWGYHIERLGAEEMKRHWRYLLARYGAYPVVWCLAGETTMPWYRSSEPEADRERLRSLWTEVARFVRESDPFHRLVSTHPMAFGSSRQELDAEDLLDFEMIQGGQDGFRVVEPTIEVLKETLKTSAGKRPVVMAEACYEGIRGTNGPDIQRLLFWKTMLSGAAGHSYGAEGVFQATSEEEPFGAKPTGMAPGTATWREAMTWPGSQQIANGKQLLGKYEWWAFEANDDWIDAPGDSGEPFSPCCAGIDDRVRVAYFPGPITPASFPIRMRELEPSVTYRATYFDPIRDETHQLGPARADEKGGWELPLPPIMQDWVLILERQEDGKQR